MQAPVADTANNWVEVAKTKDGKYRAAVGKETFDVTIIVGTADGRILYASMENPCHCQLKIPQIPPFENSPV